MKNKIISLLLCAGLVASFAACSSEAVTESASSEAAISSTASEDSLPSYENTDTAEDSASAEEGSVISETLAESSEESSEVITAELDSSYTTQWGAVNLVTYPEFTFDYPSSWQINSEVTQSSEIVTLTNERGVVIQYSFYMGPVGGLGKYARRAEITKAADSSFVPGYVQGTDYSNIGEFTVALAEITGSMGPTDSDYVSPEEPLVFYAVLPASMEGTVDGLMGLNEIAFSFDYAGYVSFCNSDVVGGLTEAEKQETIEILSSFRVVE